ncbi:MAG: hypothetical protein QOG15_3017 [Solirubrobacteraceae bacterium]|nr:hypothetical protein [Solirubrobacteraceae bacterium]
MSVRRLALRWRLTLAFAAVMAILLAASGVFVHQRMAANLDGAINAALHARSADVSALAKQSDTGLWEDRENRAAVRDVQFAQLIDASGHVLDRTPGIAARPLLAPRDLSWIRRGHRLLAGRRYGDNPVRVYAAAIRAQDQQLVVVVGQSLEPRDRALADLSGVLLLGGPLALVLVSLGGYLLTGAALRPLDDMIARVQAAIAHERTFVADASHELRSPLAMLRTELELIARDAPSGDALQLSVGSAIAETGRLGQLADDLLLLTRADENQLAIQTARVPARELLDAAAARARRRRPPSHVQLTVDAPADAIVDADGDRVAQALDNLLANAMRYADTQIALTARTRDATVELHVCDDGPGFPPDFLPQAWTRFARADAGRTEDGTGLGLAIVQMIAELHGTSAHAANRSPRGADVWIDLPRASRLAQARGGADAVDHDRRRGDRPRRDRRHEHDEARDGAGRH